MHKHVYKLSEGQARARRPSIKCVVMTKAVKTQWINNILSGAYPREALAPSVTAGAVEEKTITGPAIVSHPSRENPG